LKRAIHSVLLQDYKNIEILICDDSSTDGTADYVNELIAEGKNIRYFCTERQSGACAARNMGIFSAKGEFITGLDDDDEFMPDRISSFVSAWDEKY
ncbi:TPA: glycosyltransferase family 2 protein, partial [Escherichia coli]